MLTIQAKKDGTCKDDCLHSMLFKMTESSAKEKEVLLCAPCEVPELSVGGGWLHCCTQGNAVRASSAKSVGGMKKRDFDGRCRQYLNAFRLQC